MTPWEEVYGLLASAVAQSIPSDDKIIMESVREARDIALREMRKEWAIALSARTALARAQGEQKQ